MPDEYKVPQNWIEVAKSIHEAAQRIRDSATGGEQLSIEVYFNLLDKLTSALGYLIPLREQHKALVKNNKAAHKVRLKTEEPDLVKSKQGVTVSLIDNAADHLVAEERYRRDWLIGWCESADNLKRTCHEHIDDLKLRRGRHKLNLGEGDE